MNKSVLFAGLAAGVAAFFLGWIIFGMLLMDYLEAGMIKYEGLHKPEAEMNLALVFVSNLLYGLMMAWICDKGKMLGAMPGLVAGLVVGVAVYGGMALMFMAFLNWYTAPGIAVVDVLANTVWSAGTGAIAGLVLQRMAARGTAA